MIYISCPISEPVETLKDIATALIGRGYQTRYWNRTERYDNTWILGCEAMVIVLPMMSFKCPISSLPMGVRRELDVAMSLEKRILLAYKPNTSTLPTFYDIKVEFSIVSGIAGTRNALLNRGEVLKKEEEPEPVPVVDRAAAVIHKLQIILLKNKISYL
jgi:hypothetical protein